MTLIGRPPKTDYEAVVGQKFALLTVLKKIQHPRYASFLCKCDCGRETIVIWANLRRGSTKSCGCNRFRKLSLDEVVQRRMWNDYVIGARHRELPFDLSKEEFRKLINSPCEYCGHKPVGVNPDDDKIHGRYTKGIYDKKDRFNGIDRKNNEEGYHLQNVVSCCTRCNRAKWNMNDDEFLLWIRQVYLFNQKSDVYRKE